MTQPPGSLPNNKDSFAGGAADFTQSQRCPNCGAPGQGVVCEWCDWDDDEEAFVTTAEDDADTKPLNIGDDHDEQIDS